MRSKGQSNYSTKELKRIKTAMRYNKTLPKPMSTNKLANIMAKELGRPYTGVYCKMLTLKTKKTTTTAPKRVAVEGPKVSVQKQVTFGKPTKIEISNNGMTFYF